MIRRFIKLILAFLLIPLAGAFVCETVRFMAHNFSFQSLQWFLLGSASYVLVYPLVAGDRVTFIERFEHELGHAAVNGVALRHFDEFRVNPTDESIVRTHGPFNPGFISNLAPYYLPVLTVALLLVKPIITPLCAASLRHIIDFLIGLTLAFHYIALLQEFGRGQDDISRNGLVFSFVITSLANAAVLVIVVSGVLDSYGLVVGYLENSVARARQFYEICMPIVAQVIATLSRP